MITFLMFLCAALFGLHTREQYNPNDPPKLFVVLLIITFLLFLLAFSRLDIPADSVGY